MLQCHFSSMVGSKARGFFCAKMLNNHQLAEVLPFVYKLWFTVLCSHARVATLTLDDWGEAELRYGFCDSKGENLGVSCEDAWFSLEPTRRCQQKVRG